MKVLAFFIIVVFLCHGKNISTSIINNNNLSSSNGNNLYKPKSEKEIPIDLFKFNEEQQFDEEINTELKSFEDKIKDDKYIQKLNKKGLRLDELQGVLQTYAEIKKKLKKKFALKENKNKNLNSNSNNLQNKNVIKNEEKFFRFKEKQSNKEGNTNLNANTNINRNSSLQKLVENNSKIRISPLNVTINKPKEIIKGNIKLNLEQLLTAEFKNKKSSNMPIENCNGEWDYLLHGDDWNCLCQFGSNQSPIDIHSNNTAEDIPIPNKSLLKQMPNTILFDFKDPDLSCTNSSSEESLCKFPLIKNTGTEIVIEDDCGVLVMPPHMNGYKCYQLEFHSPGEHKINSEFFELEIQIYFRLEDKRIMDNTTTDNIILSVMIKGLDEENVSISKNGKQMEKIINHPFFDLLELDKLPDKKGHARLLSNFLNFDLLLDESKQPYKISKNSSSKNINVEQTSSLFQMAINDLNYDRNHPLKEFYLYNGSFTKPPCEENTQYIVLANPIFAPIIQIIKISEAILSSGNKLTNNRNIQKTNGRIIFHYKDEDNLTDRIKDLNLNQSEDEIKENKEETINYDENEEKLISKVIYSDKGSLNNIMSFAKLR